MKSDKGSFVTEVCPSCLSEVTMQWDVGIYGYKAFCPFCGSRLMLCDECYHPNGDYTDDCDYDADTDTCRHSQDCPACCSPIKEDMLWE